MNVELYKANIQCSNELVKCKNDPTCNGQATWRVKNERRATSNKWHPRLWPSDWNHCTHSDGWFHAHNLDNVANSLAGRRRSENGLVLWRPTFHRNHQIDKEWLCNHLSCGKSKWLKHQSNKRWVPKTKNKSQKWTSHVHTIALRDHTTLH